MVTDYWLLAYAEDTETIRRIQTQKGWFYVGATAVLLYYLICNSLQKQKKTRDRYLKATEKALEKAKESDRLKSAFLNNLSHEIRTPMNSILGFSEMLREKNISQDDRERFALMIGQGGQRLLDVMNDIVNISTIESGQEVIWSDPVNVNALLCELHREYSGKVNPAQVVFECRSQLSDEETRVITDKAKLSQVLTHLVKNAVKFTRQGQIVLECQKKDNMLFFRVSDTGRGIDAEFQDIIFTRFRQVEADNSLENEGMGLGLPIARAYVELMGGDIWLESSPDRGSVFSFVIPWVPGTRDGALMEDGTSPPAGHARPGSILVAEDEYSNFLLIETLLAPYPYKLIHATNGRDAVEHCLQDQGIRLVIMDLKLPEMDGLEATRLIKKNRPALPVLAVTAYAMKNDGQKAIDAGCDAYLAKPIRRNELLEAVSRFM